MMYLQENQKLVERIVGNCEFACVDNKALQWRRKHEPIAKKSLLKSRQQTRI
jgi:hypothetical protein